MEEDRPMATDDSGKNGKLSPPDQAAALTREGEELFNDGRIDDARKAFERALRIDPDNVAALNNIGVLSWHTGDEGRAVECFERVLTLDPCNEDAAVNLHEIHASGRQAAARAQGPDEGVLSIRVRGGLTVCVPGSLKLMTPYILMEQEDWFEDEIHFIRKALGEGMKVIDIGANYGLYTLNMAKIAGPTGRVWAFEPTSRTAAFLRKSIGANGLANIELVQAGMSDRKGSAQISLSDNPELNAITDEPEAGISYETVDLVSLDECAEIHPWDSIDFIKLDAEGHEHNIVLGGRRFLATRSPLIMFELHHGEKLNTVLIDDFRELGYGFYHLVPGPCVLAPMALDRPSYPFQLNLFCCKEDRAEKLRGKGLLVTGSPHPEPLGDPGAWRQGMISLPYYSTIMVPLASTGQGRAIPGWEAYESALSCYGMAQEEGRSADSRYACLCRACEECEKALSMNVTMPRLITHTRLMSELGRRADAFNTVTTVLNFIDSGKTVLLNEPFIPVCERFDRIAPLELSKWLPASLIEFREKARAFSSFYTGSTSLESLELMKNLGYQSPEMERRRQLIRMRFDMQDGPSPSPLLAVGSEDNLNPWFWNACAVSEERRQNIAALLGLSLEGKIRIVDIGAMDIEGSGNNYEVLLSEGLAAVTGFEPLEEECRKLNASGSATRTFLPHAVGDGTRRAFHITNTGMTSSLLEPNHDLCVKFQNLDELMQVVRTVEMQTVRLDDIPEVLDTDFLKIDVQGAEKMIFDNAARVLENTLVIQTEVEFVALYKDQPLFADIDRGLRSHGFEFHRFLGTAGRAFKPLFMKDSINRPISQTLWADAIYVKSFMELDRLSERKLLKYAVIMHEVFRSVDLCHLVLAEYDRRTGRDLAFRYLALINESAVRGV